MKQFNLPSQTLPHDDSWDVLVVGGGPAGSAAATAAAREGASTLLIEATGTLGGMGTSGLVTTWAPMSDQKGTVIYGGLAERMLRESKKAMPHLPPDLLDWVRFNPEQVKRLYDDMVLSAGAKLRFNTSLCSVQSDGAGAVTAVIVADKSGLQALSAKLYVDCTGDGDLAAMAGAEFDKGAPATGEMQPATLCFLVANVNTEAYLRGPRLHPGNPQSPIYAILKSGKYPAIKDGHLCNDLLWPGVVTFNAGHVWDIDGTDPASVSRGLVEGRKLAAQLRDALAEYCPEAFGNSVLVATAPSLGIRESRRIIGDYVLSVEDYMARRSFADEIGRNNYWIDIHTAKSEISEARKNHTHVTGRFEHYAPGESHGIPYRCLTPKTLRNVLVAGRCISCDRPVQGTIRTMPACLVTGEAAGAAAAQLATISTPDAHSLDTQRLRSTLKRHGAYLP